MREIEIKTFVKVELSSGKQFVDPDFPPIKKSIYVANDENLTKDDIDFFGQLEWMRLSEVYPQQKMYDKTFKLDDLIQGALGDCYFLAGLATLTNQ